MRTHEPRAIDGRDWLTITFSAARLMCRAPITALTGIIVVNLIWANAQAAPIQLATPSDERHQAAQQFDSFAACIAYWKIVSQCLPPGLTQKDVSRLRQSLERLQSAAARASRTARAKCAALGEFLNKRSSIARPVRYSRQSGATAATWRARFELTGTGVRRCSKTLRSGRKSKRGRLSISE